MQGPVLGDGIHRAPHSYVNTVRERADLLFPGCTYQICGDATDDGSSCGTGCDAAS